MKNKHNFRNVKLNEQKNIVPKSKFRSIFSKYLVPISLSIIILVTLLSFFNSSNGYFAQQQKMEVYQQLRNQVTKLQNDLFANNKYLFKLVNDRDTIERETRKLAFCKKDDIIIKVPYEDYINKVGISALKTEYTENPYADSQVNKKIESSLPFYCIIFVLVVSFVLFFSFSILSQFKKTKE